MWSPGGGGQQAKNPVGSQIYAFVWCPGGGLPNGLWPVLPSNNGILPSNNGVLPSNKEYYRRITAFAPSGGPICRGPRELHKYSHLCGARGAQYAKKPMEARGAVQPRTPGGSHTKAFMRGPGGSVRQEARELHQYMPLCEARGCGGSKPGTPGGSQIYAFVWCSLMCCGSYCCRKRNIAVE